jgi:hypothetical protein
VTGGTVSVKLNNLIGPYIKSHKGVRQGDPLSPILFNFVADGLTRMIHKANQMARSVDSLIILYLMELLCCSMQMTLSFA